MRTLCWFGFALAAACAVDVTVPPGYACNDQHPCVSGHICSGGVCVDAGGTGGGAGGSGGGTAVGGGAGGGGGVGGGACTGCLSQGQCRTGDQVTSCGMNGVQCVNCSSTASDCTNGMCLCHGAAACMGADMCFTSGCSTCATACPGGCCQGNICRTERKDRCSSAGLGSVCIDCGLTGDGCDAGCLCGDGPPCGNGKTCTNGICFDAGFGPCGACDGCCPPDGGTCVGKNFTSLAQCGRSGQICTACGSQMVCQQGSCINP
jgi:hypothetical protein